MKWRLPILACGEGCTFAVGRAACNLTADLKLTRGFGPVYACCSCLNILKCVGWCWSPQLTVASRFEKHSLSWCTVWEPAKSGEFKVEGKTHLEAANCVTAEWLGDCHADFACRQKGLESAHSVHGQCKDLSRTWCTSLLFAERWRLLCERVYALKFSVVPQTTMGIAYHGNSVLYP